LSGDTRVSSVEAVSHFSENISPCVSLVEVAFINHVVFPACCSLLLVTRFTTTPLHCASFLPKEAFTDRHGQVLMGGRDPRLQAVTARETANGGSSVTCLLQATSEIIAEHF